MAPSYRVVVTSLARAQLLALGKFSFYAAGRDEITQTLRLVSRELSRDPRSAGNPMYHLRVTKLEVRNLIHASLYIEYGVYEPESLVIIRSVTSFRGQVE